MFTRTASLVRARTLSTLPAAHISVSSRTVTSRLSPLFRSQICAISSRAASAVRIASIVRHFSTSTDDDDSHDDFKPKRKTPPSSSPSSSSSSDEALATIKSDVTSHPVFIYMKGTPDAPRCGFSANVVRILQHLGAEFSARDVLEEEGIREAVKQYSDWPTLPQLYVSGEFVGGSDIVTNLFKSGELEKLLQEAGAIKKQSA